MPIKNIYIHGNSIVSDNEIITLAGIGDYPSFLKSSTGKMKKNIMKNIYIKDVSIKRGFFNVLDIYIDEVKPLFVKTSDNKLVLDDGQELKNENLVVVPRLINFVPDTIYKSFIKKVGNFKPEILDKVSEIQYDPNDFDDSRFILYMVDGNYVYLTLVKFDLLNYYNEVVATLEGKKGILYLDSGNHFVAFGNN